MLEISRILQICFAREVLLNFMVLRLASLDRGWILPAPSLNVLLIFVQTGRSFVTFTEIYLVTLWYGRLGFTKLMLSWYPIFDSHVP